MGDIGGMPKVSVYLPEELAAEVRRRGLPLSSLAQQAVREAIQAEDTSSWVARMRAREPVPTREVDLSGVMASVRDELGE